MTDVQLLILVLLRDKHTFPVLVLAVKKHYQGSVSASEVSRALFELEGKLLVFKVETVPRKTKKKNQQPRAIWSITRLGEEIRTD